MSLFGQAKRHAPSKPRRSPLPIFTGETEKFGLSTPVSSSRWFTIILVPVPRLPLISRDFSGASNNGPSKAYYSHLRASRYVRLPLPIPPRLYARFARLNPILRITLVLIATLSFVLFMLGFRKSPGGRNTWNPPFVDPDTLVITPEEVAAIWEWEVLSGHHPSLQEVPDNIPIHQSLTNPAVPPSLIPAQATPGPLVAYQHRTTGAAKKPFIGRGATRRYLSSWDTVEAQPGFPPRPVPGSIIDLDLVLEKCDFGNNKYVRDCLELLRVGGNLDNGKRVRRGNYISSLRQMYLEESFDVPEFSWTPPVRSIAARSPGLSRSPLVLPKPNPVISTFDSRDGACDPLHPRRFHMFWAGPFTDKPYMAVMSFLFTQNLGLDKPPDHMNDKVGGTCRPQFWVWINPGPAASVPNPSAHRDMYNQLRANPWSSPFMHERFQDVVKFKMWNTTEQLDGIEELKPYWRDMPIFNSGGNVYKQQKQQEAQQTPEARSEDENMQDSKSGEILADAESTTEATITKKKGGLFDKVGSSSESDYDRLSVILSDMARFVLTHRFGGIYLDADTIFLRDWEELWNYRGQFAYRWSWHQKYNTAVLKLHKGSALSTFLFKTALENGLDFHPMTVSRYLKDAGLDKLLFRIPDALFDPAWLNMERYQRERPPFPYFPEFSVFFSNDKFDTAGPEPLGFDGFFRGAFSYHFHNFWWKPFDPSRDWPDLGERFADGEKLLKEEARSAAVAAAAVAAADAQEGEDIDTTTASDEGVTTREDMDDEVDLSWSTVLKRTFEGYLRAERPNMYGEWIDW